MTTSTDQPTFPPPPPVSWEGLIAAGRTNLIPQQPEVQPSPAAIRRAISAAYYAAFHALATSNAEALLGTAQDPLTADAWFRIYRGLNHNQARVQLQQNRASFSASVQHFVDLFHDLQNERHNADYNPLTNFTAQTTAVWLDRTEAVITDFLHTSLRERAAVAIFTLIRPR